MDYKYIKQLLRRYEDCLTTKEEEEILQSFFNQQVLPAELAPYKALFEIRRREAEIKPSDDLEGRILEAVGLPTKETAETDMVATKVVKTRHMTIAARLQPLYRAAAAIAIVTLLGTAAQHSFTNRTEENSAFPGYAPQAQSEKQKVGTDALEAEGIIKQGQETASADSAKLIQTSETANKGTEEGVNRSLKENN